MSDDDQDVPFVAASVPQSTASRDLWACRSCGLVKTIIQFEEEGCDNCDPGNPMGVDAMQETCTTNFSGFIAIMDPDKSWCARWIRKKKYIPGCYALKIEDDKGQEM
eukprot:jgi/Ulvmu1/2272/UM013_0119.1